jgi:hypothetical protein
MVVETNKKAKSKKLGRNRGIPKSQLGFSLDQKMIFYLKIEPSVQDKLYNNVYGFNNQALVWILLRK